MVSINCVDKKVTIHYIPFIMKCSETFSYIKPLAPGRSGFNFKSAIFNLVLLNGIFRSSYDNALRWMSWDLSEDNSTLVQIMAWWGQATNHYLSQCWPRSLSPYGVTRPQWVKLSRRVNTEENNQRVKSTNFSFTINQRTINENNRLQNS